MLIKFKICISSGAKIGKPTLLAKLQYKDQMFCIQGNGKIWVKLYFFFIHKFSALKSIVCPWMDSPSNILKPLVSQSKKKGEENY